MLDVDLTETPARQPVSSKCLSRAPAPYKLVNQFMNRLVGLREEPLDAFSYFRSLHIMDRRPSLLGLFNPDRDERHLHCGVHRSRTCA